MYGTNIFIIKSLLLLWILCVVLCEHQKRDVHRIVIRQRIPRSHKKGHGHDHIHSHSSRNKGHSRKKGKKHHNSYEKDSSEDDNSYGKDNSNSGDNSPEELFQKKHKGHKSRQRDMKKMHSPSHHVHQNYEESKSVPYKDTKFTFQNEWVPVSIEQLYQGSHESSRDRHKRKRNTRKSYLTSLKPPPIELTTAFPFQFESSSIFPQLISYNYPGEFSNFNFNQKTLESNQSPLIGTIEHPSIQFAEINENYNRLKNHKASYEITEFTPVESKTSTFISVSDENNSKEPNNEDLAVKLNNIKEEEIKSTQKPIRSRGRHTFRGQKKA